MSMEASLQETPDGELVAAARGGDRLAYAALIKRYAGRVFAVCLGVLGNVTDAEDIAQETFMRGLTNIQSLRDDERYREWISQIARNLCRDYYKTTVRRRELLQNRPPIAGANPKDHTELFEALAKLPEKHRLTLSLYYLDGCNIAGVAEELGASEAAAYTRLSRARRALRIILEDRSRDE